MAGETDIMEEDLPIIDWKVGRRGSIRLSDGAWRELTFTERLKIKLGIIGVFDLDDKYSTKPIK